MGNYATDYKLQQITMTDMTDGFTPIVHKSSQQQQLTFDDRQFDLPQRCRNQPPHVPCTKPADRPTLSNNTRKENTNKNYILTGNYVPDYKLQLTTVTDSITDWFTPIVRSCRTKQFQPTNPTPHPSPSNILHTTTTPQQNIQDNINRLPPYDPKGFTDILTTVRVRCNGNTPHNPHRINHTNTIKSLHTPPLPTINNPILEIVVMISMHTIPWRHYQHPTATSHASLASNKKVIRPSHDTRNNLATLPPLSHPMFHPGELTGKDKN